MDNRRLGSRLIMKYQGKTYESAWEKTTKEDLGMMMLKHLSGSAAFYFDSEQGGRIVIGREVLQRAVFIVKECYETCGEPVQKSEEATKEESK